MRCAAGRSLLCTGVSSDSIFLTTTAAFLIARLALRYLAVLNILLDLLLHRNLTAHKD